MVIIVVVGHLGEEKLFYAKTTEEAENTLLLKGFTLSTKNESVFWEDTYRGCRAKIKRPEASIPHISDLC